MKRHLPLSKLVTIFFPSIISKQIGVKKVAVAAKTLREALDRVAEIYGNRVNEMMFEESGGLNRFLIVALNGRMIPTAEILTTPLEEYDEVAILVVIGGG